MKQNKKKCLIQVNMLFFIVLKPFSTPCSKFLIWIDFSTSTFAPPDSLYSLAFIFKSNVGFVHLSLHDNKTLRRFHSVHDKRNYLGHSHHRWGEKRSQAKLEPTKHCFFCWPAKKYKKPRKGFFYWKFLSSFYFLPRWVFRHQTKEAWKKTSINREHDACEGSGQRLTKLKLLFF